MEKFVKLNALKFALAAGIWLGICFMFTTISSLVGVPGLTDFSKILVSWYGWWGYSISIQGIFIGTFYGFIEGFVHFGIFALIYNKLLSWK
ncbi:MAG: hypothetical protein PHD81_02775 [Candidatus Nanoarchaeia archaeon]|nr:hypothetical protein [Candidatus Nanoarchaeia archaeon]MDD5588008.1 hypothetical protein [Candidatus Nanoarchaeia archaeon]